MRDKFLFFSLTALAALTISPIVGAIGTSMAYLAGMQGKDLVVLFGTATGGTFGALMMLAGLAATLFFGSKK